MILLSVNNTGFLNRKAAQDALDDLTEWLENDGEIAVFDATNTTRSRRDMVYEHCRKHKFKVIFVESICDNQDVIQASVLVSSSMSLLIAPLFRKLK